MGNREAIRKWLAKWGRTENTEALVWIVRKEWREIVRAGTQNQEKEVEMPTGLHVLTNEPKKEVEIWHNHPRVGTSPGTAAPSAADIGIATGSGVKRMCVVDNEGRCVAIERANTEGLRRTEIRDWVNLAEDLENERILKERGKPSNRRTLLERRAESAEAAVGAAVAIEVIKAYGLSDKALARGAMLALETEQWWVRLKGTTLGSKIETQATLRQNGAEEETRMREDATWQMKNEEQMTWEPQRSAEPHERAERDIPTQKTTSSDSKKKTSRTR